MFNRFTQTSRVYYGLVAHWTQATKLRFAQRRSLLLSHPAQVGSPAEIAGRPWAAHRFPRGPRRWPNTSGISGVTEYNTAGWPRASSNGPAADALSHGHVPGAVTYSVTPPVGAVSITCQPSLPQSDPRLQQFVNKFRASRQYTP